MEIFGGIGYNRFEECPRSAFAAGRKYF